MAKPLKDSNHPGFVNSNAQIRDEIPTYKFINGTAGDDLLIGSPGQDFINGGLGADRMVGGKGDDFYSVDNVGDQVIEKHGGVREGKNTVEDGDWIFLQGSFDYTLPTQVETLLVSNFDLNTSAVFTGNKLDNYMSGGYAFSTLYGLEGDDVLSVDGFSGGAAFGGKGNDSLSTAIGTLTGGEGADSFILKMPGLGTGTPVVADFNAAQGDTIQFLRTGAIPSHEELIETGALRFDPTTSTLSLDLADDLYGDQVVHLIGVTSLDLDLVSVGPSL